LQRYGGGIACHLKNLGVGEQASVSIGVDALELPNHEENAEPVWTVNWLV
jgi:hypothetical protein